MKTDEHRALFEEIHRTMAENEIEDPEMKEENQ
jgi:hypothetical protein